MYGDQMQSVVPQYLEASLEQLQRNQVQLREALAGALAVNPFAELARRNMEMFTAGAARGKPGEPEPAADSRSEIDALKAQLSDIQKKLDKLGS